MKTNVPELADMVIQQIREFGYWPAYWQAARGSYYIKVFEDCESMEPIMQIRVSDHRTRSVFALGMVHIRREKDLEKLKKRLTNLRRNHGQE